MSLNTHNIVAPSTWSIYDFVDRPIPTSTGLYPDPDAPWPAEYYTTVIPMFYDQVLPTKNKLVIDDITVKEIPVRETTTAGTTGYTLSI